MSPNIVEKQRIKERVITNAVYENFPSFELKTDDAEINLYNIDSALAFTEFSENNIIRAFGISSKWGPIFTVRDSHQKDGYLIDLSPELSNKIDLMAIMNPNTNPLWSYHNKAFKDLYSKITGYPIFEIY